MSKSSAHCMNYSAYVEAFSNECVANYFWQRVGSTLLTITWQKLLLMLSSVGDTNRHAQAPIGYLLPRERDYSTFSSPSWGKVSHQTFVILPGPYTRMWGWARSANLFQVQPVACEHARCWKITYRRRNMRSLKNHLRWMHSFYRCPPELFLLIW